MTCWTRTAASGGSGAPRARSSRARPVRSSRSRARRRTGSATSTSTGVRRCRRARQARRAAAPARARRVARDALRDAGRAGQPPGHGRSSSKKWPTPSPVGLGVGGLGRAQSACRDPGGDGGGPRGMTGPPLVVLKWRVWSRGALERRRGAPVRGASGGRGEASASSTVRPSLTSWACLATKAQAAGQEGRRRRCRRSGPHVTCHPRPRRAGASSASPRPTAAYQRPGVRPGRARISRSGWRMTTGTSRPRGPGRRRRAGRGDGTRRHRQRLRAGAPKRGATSRRQSFSRRTSSRCSAIRSAVTSASTGCGLAKPGAGAVGSAPRT